MASYKYSPLNEKRNEIRVLTLHPGDFSADIHVSIQKVALTAENPPIYEALSYVWGTTDNPVSIKVGPSGNDRLAITQNLAVALPYLRYENEIRTLWIDAICINQQDLRERSSQVKGMGDIYRLADRVVVWLGTEKDNSADVLRTLSHLGSQIKVSFLTGTFSPASSESNPYWSDESETIPYSSQELCDMDALLHRPWFSRLWVWQEIQLARSNSILVCGSEIILWQSFRRAIFCVNSKDWDSDLIRAPFRLKRRIMQVIAASDTESVDTFGGASRSLASCKCTDPRDRIYAVMSLLRGSDRDFKIEPDYTQTTAQVYLDAALRYIEHRERLNILTFCELQSDRPAEMPSWVPNWEDAHTATSLGTGESACGHSMAKVQCKRDGVLSVTGVISATVSTAEKMILQNDYMQVFDQTRRLVPPNAENSAYVSGGSLIDAFFRTFCANSFRDTARPRREDYPQFQESRDSVLAVLQNKDLIPEYCFHDDVSVYLGLVRKYCDKRSFITTEIKIENTTEEGYIGLAPKATRPGDQICVLLGCDKPLVLRPTSSLQYQVVGECYVYGLGDGKAFLGPLPENYQAILVFLEAQGSYRGFVNKDTGHVQYNDPRISDVSEGLRARFPDGSIVPVLTPDILTRRGVKLQEFDLI